MRIYIFSLFVFGLCIMSCKTKKTMSEAPASADEISFTNISHESYSALNDPEQIMIDNASDWAEFWSRANSNSMPAPKGPEIDFSKNIVLVSCMGLKNSGGHTTEIVHTKVAGETVYATVVNSSPGKSCIATMAMTNPYHVIQLEKGSIKKVVFSTEDRVNECK